jgi:hypothetical protein
MIASAPLPTVPDSQTDWAPSAGLRSDVQASLAERTRLTLAFNAQMKERCERIGVTFIDTSSEQLDSETGLVAARFVRQDKDHHLAEGPYRAAMVRELSKVF